MKRTVFILLILALFFPLIQEKLKLFHFKSLAGVTEKAGYPQFKFIEWNDGKYQMSYENYKSQNFGFRNLFIRLYNQIDFSLFKKANAEAVIGKDGYLFQEKYLVELTGANFIGKDIMQKRMQNISQIQKYLASKNTLLITVLAPAKNYYLKNYLPDYYLNRISDESNYKYVLKFSEEENLNFIDFNKWFIDLRDTIRLPLFPRQGIHWNFYGMALCADSILKYIEAKLNVQLNDLKWRLEFPDTPYGTDNDVGDLLNIVYPLPFEKMPVPKFEFSNDTANKKLTILTIGDSFYGNICSEKIFENIFKKESYYYYCASIYPPGSTSASDPADLNFLKELEKYDVILLMQTSSNYHNPGVGFTDLFNLQMEFKKRYLSEAINIIDTSDVLKERVSHMAIENKITIDSAKAVIADSISENKINNLSEIKVDMRNNGEWLDALKLKSEKTNTLLERIMQGDAEWVLLNK